MALKNRGAESAKKVYPLARYLGAMCRLGVLSGALKPILGYLIFFRMATKWRPNALRQRKNLDKSRFSW
jgi:hypothetical protein